MASIKKISKYPAAVSDLKLTDVDNDPPISEAIEIWEVPNAYVTCYGYVLKKFKNVEFFTSPRHRNSFSQKAMFSQYFLKEKIKVKGTVISFVHGWYANYYHFVTECLPKLFVLKDYLADATVVFPATVSKFHHEYIDLLGLNNVVYITEQQIIDADLVVSCNFMNRDLNHHHIITPGFRDWILEKVEDKPLSKPLPKRFFINREKATYRKVMNNEELMSALGEIQNLNLEDYSIVEQVSLFHNAEEIHAIHGAALSNLIFCKEQTKVIEYIHEDFIQHCFHKLSHDLKLNYHKVKCRGNTVHQLPGYCDIEVPLNFFK